MQTFFLAIHILVCFLLIFVVLVQGGKGAQMGAAFGGGGSQTLFGGRGAATFLGKMTTVIAVVFMLTSLILAVLASKGGDDTGLDLSAPAATEAPLGTELPAATTLDKQAEGEGSGLPAPAQQAPIAPPSEGQGQ
jgi:preprotein translocase subunit SecG